MGSISDQIIHLTVNVNTYVIKIYNESLKSYGQVYNIPFNIIMF